MVVFDTSSMIYAWDNYPLRQFPGLWDWIAAQILEEKLVMPVVAFEEVAYKAPECSAWLKEKNLKQLEMDNDILQRAIHIKDGLGIANDCYHPKGVDENDIFIIATARIYGAILVTDEGRQTKLPAEPSKRKIPAVCKMKGVNVDCINFVDFIKSSEEIF